MWRAASASWRWPRRAAAYPDNGVANPFLLIRDAPIEQIDAWRCWRSQASPSAVVAALAVVRWRRASPPTARVLRASAHRRTCVGRHVACSTSSARSRTCSSSVAISAVAGRRLVGDPGLPRSWRCRAHRLPRRRAAMLRTARGGCRRPDQRYLRPASASNSWSKSLIRVLRDPSLTVLYRRWRRLDRRAAVMPSTYPAPRRRRVRRRRSSRMASVVATILHDAVAARGSRAWLALWLPRRDSRSITSACDGA